MINNFDIDDFLQHYWQQKPLLIRQAIPDLQSPLSPEELAGLACEEEVESRIVINRNDNHELAHGPFDEDMFTSLPDKDWTLLVQAVDHYDRDVAELLNYFRFIPNWRIDDIMVSYATKNGGIPAHVDNYDVFLLQGAGTRQWQLGAKCDHSSQIQDNEQLRLLLDFEVEEEWILNPGDMLYVPPMYGHRGTSLDNDCMTYSIGFRAPSHGELLSDFCDHHISLLTEQDRYTDPYLKQQQYPGEITEATIDKIHGLLQQFTEDKSAITEWFGRFMTSEKYPQETNTLYEFSDITEKLTQLEWLYRDGSSRFAYTTDNGIAKLYVNGEPYDSSLDTAKLLSNNDHYPVHALPKDPQSMTLIIQLIQQGSLYFEEQHSDDFHD